MTTPSRLPARRSTLTASLGVAALLGFGSARAQSPAKLSLRFDFLPYGSHGPFYLAQERGWFRDAGVEPSFEDGNGSATAVQLVDGGRHDLAYVSFASSMVARDKGMTIKAVAGVLRKSDLGVLVDERSDIHKPKDLEGKRIFFSPASVETLFIDTWFRQNGVEKSKVNLTALDVGTKVSTYLGGQGDGMFVPLPIYTVRESIPRLSRGMPFADFGLPLPGFGVIASDTAIRTKAPAIRGFLVALRRAWTGIQDRSLIDEATEALLKNRQQSRLAPGYVRAQLEAVIPYMDTAATAGKPLFWQAPEDWAAALKSSEAAGVIKANSRPENFYTNDLLPAAG